jgi:hypothetical protein
VDPDTPTLPSPTYEEAMAEAMAAAATGAEERSGPPSYVTRESPARQVRREVVRQESEDGAERLARAQSVVPEMVEGRGIGLAS